MSDKQYAAPSVTDAIHRRAWEIMSDGRWYDYERVVAELMKVVPPSMALRRAQQRWEAQANTPKRTAARGGRPPERWEFRSREDEIRSGQRDWVVATIQPRPSRSVPAVYQYDPPTINKAGGNRHGRFTGRKIRITGPNRVIKGDLRREPWTRPVLTHLAGQAAQVRDEWAVAAIRQAAHEQGFHLPQCPPGCTLSTLQALDDELADEGDG